MDPEEMDIVELLADVPVEPGWRAKVDGGPDMLKHGTRGMIVHRDEGTALYDVEFVDDATKDLMVLARLRGDQVRVVERYTLEEE